MRQGILPSVPQMRELRPREATWPGGGVSEEWRGRGGGEESRATALVGVGEESRLWGRAGSLAPGGSRARTPPRGPGRWYLGLAGEIML